MSQFLMKPYLMRGKPVIDGRAQIEMKLLSPMSITDMIAALLRHLWNLRRRPQLEG
jgi:hypothetical protein